ncbi:deoxyribose-phosphate aldolase [Lacticigenium naphthae]|uniref:deoxyribose-phosphate aldolase n=1 Tax=Lacticigenium naphthae TaxID=515351 RepID=UPI000416D689|nr:deoxyribose-phosphate aldolase [Lacticigenium naphthae]
MTHTSYTLDDCMRMIDHTNLKPFATHQDMELLCDEAIRYHFKMVAINQVQTAFCSQRLKKTDIHTGAAIAFPLGQTTIAAKVSETLDAIENGADEIDYVVNLTEVKEGNWLGVKNEMESIVEICREHTVLSKVIFETCYLEMEEIQKLALIAKEVKPDFIKTSTGFGTGGATVEAVRLMKETVGDQVAVKAAGGIRDAETFLAMVQAGATRIGTSSGIKLYTELKALMKENKSETIEL